MPPSAAPFVQRLEGLDLSIEKGTERTTDRYRYHVFFLGQLIESARSLPKAQAVFRRLRDENGWQPPPREQLSPEEKLERHRAAIDRLDHLEYWGRRTSSAAAGDPSGASVRPVSSPRPGTQTARAWKNACVAF